MKRHLNILLLSIMVISCKENLDYWQVNYPAELEYQIDLFKQYAPPNLKAKKLTIVLTGHGLRTSKGKLCAGLSCPKDQTIYLDTTSSHWMDAKTALVLHELGHYVLKRKHNIYYFIHPSEPSLKIPVSVMHTSSGVKESFITENMELQQYYLNELFNGY